MKQLLILSILAIAISSCCQKMQYTYKITYVDGTSETLTKNHQMKFIGNADCISDCDCDNSNRICGVKKLELISKTEVKSKNVNNSNQSVDGYHKPTYFD